MLTDAEFIRQASRHFRTQGNPSVADRFVHIADLVERLEKIEAAATDGATRYALASLIMELREKNTPRAIACCKAVQNLVDVSEPSPNKRE